MFQVFTCLTTEHDGRIVALAVLLCLLASAAAISLFYRAQEAEGSARYLWLSLDTIAAGSGIWATHFIAMLAYETGIGITYDLRLTLASLLIAIAVTGIGLLVAIRKGWANDLVGGAIVGLGICAMHYTGIAAIEAPGHPAWDFGLVTASILLGTVFGALAFLVAGIGRHWANSLVATLLLALAILGLHFTGMTALSFRPDPSLQIAGTLSRDSLSIGVAGIATVIIGMCLVAAFSDLRSRRQLRKQKILLDAALENMSQGLCMFDPKGRIALYNDRYLKMFDLSAAALEGRTLLDVLRSMNRDAPLTDPEAFYAGILRDMRSGKRAVRVIRMSDGRSLRVTDQPMSNGGWVATFEDITEWQKNQAQISHMAHHDNLTDLPNRTLFREQLAQALRKTARNEKVAVHCIDLDHFKNVNDTLGHPVGDELLKQVAARLQSCIKDSDMVARLGGDEFAIVQAENDLDPSKAAALASRIVEDVGAPYNVSGHEIVVGASVGIAVAPEDGNDPDRLLRNADMALYRAKLDGRETYRFFEPGMDATAQARRVLELDLRAALLRSEFEVWYQPIHDLRTGRIKAFEALVRWNHPQLGMVQPDRFIKLAEETGLIVPIGEWVLRRACADAAGWSQDVGVAVNLSPAQFRNRHLVASIFKALADSGLVANRLELEITEAVLLQDNEQTLASLHQLHEHGIRISMDDFGTGYSSLSYLRSFPFDKIKIDRSFVRDLSSRDDSMAIVRAVTGLGKSLGITTTAEGVETREQLSLLTAEGCTEVQGFLFNAPQPAANVEKMLAGQSQRRSA